MQQNAVGVVVAVRVSFPSCAVTLRFAVTSVESMGVNMENCI